MIITYRENSRISRLNVVHTVHSGRRGRPTTVIDPEYLAEATLPTRGVSIKKLTRILGVHRNTL